MPLASRRRVLTGTASLALTAAAGPALVAMGPNDKFDLLIKGGDVLDPSQSLRARRDIGIRYGLIEAVAPDGQIEAVRLEGADFVVGVQWHPEWRALENVFSRKLFEAFGAACARRAEARANFGRAA